MEHKLTIFGKLPGMNQWIRAQNTNRFKGASMKRDAQDICEYYIRNQLKNLKITKPVRIHYTWYEENQRRDHDNVSGFGHKVIQDALVECKVIKNDGWKEILGYTDEFKVDKDNPRVEILIEEVGGIGRKKNVCKNNN